MLTFKYTVAYIGASNINHMYRKDYKEKSPFKHLFNRLEKAHKYYGTEPVFTPLDVLAMLHLAMPKGLGWDVAYALSVKAGCTREEADASLEKLRQITMKLGSSRTEPSFIPVDYESGFGEFVPMDF